MSEIKNVGRQTSIIICTSLVSFAKL